LRSDLPFLQRLTHEPRFDWSGAIRTTFPDFLSEYTLHDSSWIGLWTPFNDSHSVVIIDLDTAWSAPHITGNAYLLFRFQFLPLLISTSVSDPIVGPTIGSASSRSLSKTEIESIANLAIGAASLDDMARSALFESELHQTTINTIVSDQITLIHPPLIDLLCFDAEGNQKPIPKLPKQKNPTL
jgi:hypothetical protein